MLNMNDFIHLIMKLPGVGKKNAGRLAFFLLKNKDIALEISSGIEEITNNIIYCSICGDYSLNDPCRICEDVTRDHTQICVVEYPQDMKAVEETGKFQGVYHILMGTINPLEGVGPDKIRLNELLERLKNNIIHELFLAINPTVDGEATILYIMNLMASFDLNIKKSRIATGIPLGGSLEYTDVHTLGMAIQQKQYF